MSWDSKDSQRQQGRGAVGPARGSGALPDAVAPKDGPPDAAPATADMLCWDAAGDGTADAGVSQAEARELAAMGMVSDRGWAAWSRIARRGVTEI